MNSVYASLPPTIFTTMSALATELGAINLGQAFPEWDGPADVREAAARALIESSNQYPPMRGLPETREAVAAHYNAHHGLDIDWKTEVTITSGATEAIACALLSVIEPGDEVVLIEPMYDCYWPMVRRAGGVPRFVRLEPPHWRLTKEMLAAVWSEKTRAIVLNTPNNPAASVMSDDELALVAKFCRSTGAVAISDEVWEHVLFDGRTHASMLHHLREATIKVGSAGKMFAMTGWKVGFACAAPPLSELFAKAHQFLTFTTAPNLQRGVAYGLAKPANYFDEMRADLERRRDRLTRGLSDIGYSVLPSFGAYFVSVDLTKSGVDASDEDFAMRAVREAGVATIPYAPFYAEGNVPRLVRLCFAKSDETLDRGLERLDKARRLFV